jgi:hypothetical protein
MRGGLPGARVHLDSRAGTREGGRARTGEGRRRGDLRVLECLGLLAVALHPLRQRSVSLGVIEARLASATDTLSDLAEPLMSFIVLPYRDG